MSMKDAFKKCINAVGKEKGTTLRSLPTAHCHLIWRLSCLKIILEYLSETF